MCYVILRSATCHALDVTHEENTWRKVKTMRPKFGLKSFSIVAYGDKLFAVGGYQKQRKQLSIVLLHIVIPTLAATFWRSIAKCAEYDPAADTWTYRSDFYENWPIAKSCIAADKESNRIYSLAGYSYDDR